MTILKNFGRWLPVTQGVYFFITGVWPLLHIESFIWLSGPKYDLWLVKTVGISLAMIGLHIFMAGYYRRIFEETVILAAGSAAALATVDIYYVNIGRIWTIYLLDGVIEIVFVLFWLFYSRRSKKAS